MVETTAMSVVAPFICMTCEAAIEKFASNTQEETLTTLKQVLGNPGVQEELAWQGEGIDIEAVAQFYRDMAPKGESPQTYEDVVALDDEDCAHWKVATVENTNLLIADLEAQLKAVTNDRDELDRDMTRAGQQIDSLERDRDHYRLANLNLHKQLAQTKGFLDGRDRDSTVMLSRIDELEMNLFVAKARIGNLFCFTHPTHPYSLDGQLPAHYRSDVGGTDVQDSEDGGEVLGSLPRRVRGDGAFPRDRSAGHRIVCG
jgi:hypothetical protein